MQAGAARFVVGRGRTSAAYLEVPVGFKREWLTNVYSISGHLGHLKLVDAVLVTIVADLQFSGH